VATTRSRLSVAEAVATKLRSAIFEGRLRPGDPLPSERELATQYEVNRSSIREAMTRLEAWGLVNIRHGGATRVRDYLLSASLDLLPSWVHEGGRLDPGILRELHEIRALLLGWCAEQAARKADASSLLRLEELARKLADPKTKVPELQELDYEFFHELARITGNRLLLLFSNLVRQVYLGGKDRFVSLYDTKVFDPRHHARAVEAIRKRDAQAAGDAMRAHANTALESMEVD
jgi:DNA-binding FadR family transcriptional regulator